ncbi:hypothetical protein KIL84_004302 [Mauremys mutica]|uniref:Uncharacterized protein n=1 Tax=Mauremys mutica TaxID=74926 RepID=A0A9D3XPG1_9SAUR|nr:hypothetical protein KIL84_004302 [Mauremys mutica]
MAVRGFEESEPLVGYVTTVPDGPSDLRAVNVADTAALLRWRPPRAPVQSYELSYGPPQGPSVTLRLPGDRAEHPLAGLRLDTEYLVSVHGVTGGNRSSPASATFTTGLDAPRDLRATEVTPRSARLSWTPPRVPPAGYLLSYETPSGQTQVFAAMGSYDLGCSPGSGADALGVFEDAGLALRVGGLESPVRSVNPERDEDEFFDDDSVQTRSVFPESWLWKTLTVQGSSRQTHLVPDSITTWEIQAVSMSPTTGICVSDPLSVRVFQDFHLSLRLPYAVKRFEQLELRPVLYNYRDRPVNVSVHMERSEGICSPATGDRVRRQAVQVPAKGALAVPFTVVPMGAADIPITITAQGGWGLGDSVARSLRVEREGTAQLEEMSYSLDSEERLSRALEIPGELPPNALPDGDFKMSVRVTADEPVETLEKSLSPAGLVGLLRVPRGCAEQTMIYMAPGLYAMRYLDETEQWAQLRAERKQEGLEHLRVGYERILTFRKADGSYGAWLHRDSSTWLTAFVVKVLALSRQYQDVDAAGIRESVTWLLGNQQTDGSFRDPHPVIHRDMQGGVGGQQGGVSLTAFVVVALKQALALYEEQEADPELQKETQEQRARVRSSLSRATRYLAAAPEQGRAPYPAAISAYALSLASDDAGAIGAADRRLRELALRDSEGTMMFWAAEEGGATSASAISVETTAYALLHLVLHNDLATAKKVLKMYNVLELHNSSCQSLGLEVTVSGDVRFEVDEEDYDYDYGGEAPAAEAPLHPIHWFDARRRRRREAADPGQRNKDVAYSVCIWRKPGSRLSGMAIADITLLSGFQPHVDDLDKLKDLADRYISHYEVQGQRLLLYFETVPQERDCVGFRAAQPVPVGLLQPASASLYDFYEPGYEVRVQQEEELSGFRAYEAEILEPLQFTEDVGLKAGQSRRFLVRGSCRTRLVPGSRYLVMGQDGETLDPQGRRQYLLDAAAWIELLPEPSRCRATAHRNLCAQLRAFAQGYGQNGCRV